MEILSDAEKNKDIPSLEIVKKLISEVVAKTVPCDNEVITENYKLGTNVQTALSNLLTYTYVNASGISQLSTGLQNAWNAINAIPEYTGGSGIVVSGSVIGHSNNLTAEGTVNTGEIQTPDFGENASLTWFRYDKQGHVTFTGSGGIKIPTADTTLSSTSTRPISSKAVYDNLEASVIRATTKTVGSGSGAVSIYDDVQETLEGFQSHIYKLHTDITTLGNNVDVLNTYKDSINISAGSTTVPVYFKDGVPTVCQYTLGSICTKSTGDYLPITGGTLTGKLTVNSDIVIPTAKAVADNTVPVSGSLATITDNDFTQLKNYKSIIGSIKNSTDNVWYDVISVRHRNGYNDGSNYGMYLYSNLTSSGDLIWNKQTAASTWQGERTIVDSGNYTTYFKNSASNIAGTGLEYVDYIDSSGKNIIKINHKKGSKRGSIGPDPVTYTPNFGETFDVGYAQYDDTGHIIMSSTATIKLPEYSALKNPYALTIQGNGTKLVTYDGAGPVTLNITPSSIGAASSSHTHSYLPLEYKSDIIINRTTLGMQCKNLLKNTASTSTVSGVTFTVNDDGSVTVNGTNTSSKAAYIQLCGLVDYGDGKLIASIGQNVTDVYMAMYDSNWNWIGTEVDGTISWENNGKKRLVRLVVKAGATINNITIYPMIRDANITNDTYEPYKESIDERVSQNTSDIAVSKSDIAINRTTLGIQCKNLLNLKSKVGTYTSSGITFVINGDGSVTANGTATANVFFYMLRNDSALGNLIYGKEVKLTGCPEGGSASTYSLRSLNVIGSNTGPVTDTGNGRVFTYTNTEKSASFYIAISKGVTVTDLTFYPMLRYAEITDDTYEPYQPSLIERCLLKDTAGIALGVSQSSSITIDNLSSYTALWIYVVGNVLGINFATNLIVPIAYLAKSTSNSVQLAGGIPSSAYTTSEGVLASKGMNGTITAKINGNTLSLAISKGTIESVEVISLM